MQLSETWPSCLNPHGAGTFGVGELNGWIPMPGDAVCDSQDRKGTYGIVVGVPGNDDDFTRLSRRPVMVLWTRDLQIDEDEAWSHIGR